MVSDLCPPSNDTVIFSLFFLFTRQNALNTAAKIGGQLYKASEAEGDTRDALFQVRERINKSCVYHWYHGKPVVCEAGVCWRIQPSHYTRYSDTTLIAHHTHIHHTHTHTYNTFKSNYNYSTSLTQI